MAIVDVFGGCRLIVMVCSCVLLSATIYKLRRAKVQSTQSGHMKVSDIAVCLVIESLTIGCSVMTIFVYNEHQTAQIAIDMIHELLDLLLMIAYFKILTQFVTEFQLRTKVEADGHVLIVGINREGVEVLKFFLDEEQQEKLIGPGFKHKSQNAMVARNQSIEAAGGFEILSDGRTDDFSDTGLTVGDNSLSNAGRSVHLVSAYEGPSMQSPNSVTSGVSMSGKERTLTAEFTSASPTNERQVANSLGVPRL